ncbi:MAG: ATP-dependent DNA helicase RecQ [Spirochaetales bacterium]|nr:ATP-dependent DNA helicase RecQ [Candidatus Physcosoma equi]
MDQQLIEETYRERLGIHYLKPYQELIIYQILENQERNERTRLLGCLPTGSGKSLCFMLPILLIPGLTIIVYPLLSLMADQAHRFEKAGISFVILRGGMEKEEKTKALKTIAEGGVSVCITNMETLVSLRRQGYLKKLTGRVSMFVIDEAHTVVTWGNSFRPSYQELTPILEMLSPQHLLAFTATMDEEIRKGILDRIFQKKRPYIVHASSDRENIFYHAYRSFSKMDDLEAILKPKERRPAVVFCSSREETRRTAEELIRRHFSADYYNASLDKEIRRQKEEWIFSSKYGVLASTSAYGMGVNKDNIRTIVHLSLPSSASDYLQESGRAGRDGLPADAFVLYGKEETELSPVFKDKDCIRTQLLRKMNETPESDGCFGCSHCVPDFFSPKGEKEILRYFSFFPFSTKENTVHRLIGFHLFSLFFHLKHWSHQDAEEAIGELLKNGLLIEKGKWLKRSSKGRKRLFSVKEKT